MKNHEKLGSGGDWEAIGAQGALFSPRLVQIETNLGVILGAMFDQNPYFSASCFA